MGKEAPKFKLVPEPERGTNCYLKEHLNVLYGKWIKVTGNTYACLE
ncbi:MAG: hypothetical protein ACOC5L_01095 [Halobacteriota archaeon]